MRLTLLFAIAMTLFLAPTIQAQDAHSVGDHFLEEGYFDDLEMAALSEGEVLYIDLALQNPKLKVIPEGVFQYTAVKEIDVSFNRVALVDDKIGTLTELEFLDLQGNHYLKSVSDEIAKCTKLKEVRVGDTGLSAEQKKHLKSLLPEGCVLAQ